MESENNPKYPRESIRVRTTELFRSIVKTVKNILIFVLIGIILYAFYTYFGIYFYISGILSSLVILPTVYTLLKTDGEWFLECQIGSVNNPSKQANIISLQIIPKLILQEEKYESIGKNIVKFRSSIGKTIHIVEKIDHVAKKIHYPWFSNLSDFEFYVKEETFIDLKKQLKTIMKDISKTKETRDLYSEIDIINTLDYLESEEDIKEIKDKLVKL